MTVKYHEQQNNFNKCFAEQQNIYSTTFQMSGWDKVKCFNSV